MSRVDDSINIGSKMQTRHSPVKDNSFITNVRARFANTSSRNPHAADETQDESMFQIGRVSGGI